MSKQNPTPSEKEEYDKSLEDPDRNGPLIDLRSDDEKEAAEDGRRAGKIIEEEQKKSEDAEEE